MRIGIVNDLTLAREALRRVVQSMPGHRVAWLARDGAEAVDLTKQDRPDLILMDLIMPGIDGVEATRRIMADTPCPILVVTATVSGHMNKVYEAMGHGALDAVDTPCLGPLGAGQRGERPHREDRHRRQADRADGRADHPASPSLAGADRRVSGSGRSSLLGASTGGPKALAEILAGSPRGWRPRSSSSSTSTRPSPPAWRRWLGDQTGRRVEVITPGRPARARDDPPGRDRRPSRHDSGTMARLRPRAEEPPAIGPRSTSSSRASPSTGPTRRGGAPDRHGTRRGRGAPEAAAGRLAHHRAGRARAASSGGCRRRPPSSAPPRRSCPSSRSPAPSTDRVRIKASATGVSRMSD